MRIGPHIGIPGGSSGVFTPASIPDCLLWLDAAVGVTLNGANVSAWADQSGAGNDFTQGVAANQPLLTTVGGLPAIQFDGFSEYLSRAPIAAWSSGYTAMLVANITVLGVVSRALMNGSMVAADGWRVDIEVTPSFELNHTGVGGVPFATAMGAKSSYIIRHDAGAVDLAINGAHQAQQALAADIAPPTVGAAIAARTTGASPCLMDCYAVLGWSRRLSDAETDLLAAWAAARFAI